MWSFHPKQMIPVKQLIEQILSLKDEIEGICILGGEPFDQYSELLFLCKAIASEKLSVMLYTGYDLDELKDQSKTEVLEETDILVAGRYMANKRNLSLQWRGSSNQVIHFLSERYHDSIISDNNYVEISIDEWGQSQIYGFPDKKIIKAITKS